MGLCDCDCNCKENVILKWSQIWKRFWLILRMDRWSFELVRIRFRTLPFLWVGVLINWINPKSQRRELRSWSIEIPVNVWAIKIASDINRVDWSQKKIMKIINKWKLRGLVGRGRYIYNTQNNRRRVRSLIVIISGLVCVWRRHTCKWEVVAISIPLPRVGRSVQKCSSQRVKSHYYRCDRKAMS